MRRAILGVLLLSGCGGDDCCKVADARLIDMSMGMLDANPNLTEVALLPNTVNRDLDLLFVIDDSPSTLDKQTNLKASFASFIAVLGAGGLPNLHIGVITTDMGSKGADDTNAGPDIGSGFGSCSGLGNDGALQTFASTMINGTYLSDVNGVKNYAGTLVDRFNEIASAGASGCGFEQPFHSIRRALDPGNSANVSFLRQSARLGIVLLTDEDDCSMAHSTLMGNDTTTLGALQSFRCTRFGVTCDVNGADTNQMNQVGTKSQCHSNEGSAYLADIGRYVTFLNGLKADPREIFFGAIVGPTTPVVEVELRSLGGTAYPALAHSCTYQGTNGPEVADPAVRITQLANALQRGSVATVCNGNLGTAMSDIATQMRPLIGDTCLTQVIAQPTVCEAFDIDGLGNTTALAQCDAANTPPCFGVIPDATACPSVQNLRVNLVRAAPVSADTWTSIRCQL